MNHLDTIDDMTVGAHNLYLNINRILHTIYLIRIDKKLIVNLIIFGREILIETNS